MRSEEKKVGPRYSGGVAKPSWLRTAPLLHYLRDTAVGTFRTKGSIDISEADEQQMQIRGYGDSSFQLNEVQVNQSLRVFRSPSCLRLRSWLFVINIISRCDVSGLFPFFPPY